MFNDFSIEVLKTKRTIIRKLTWIFPILVVLITALFFASTGYVVQSVINQWSFLWASLYLALTIGLIDRHEKVSTSYKMILGSPANLSIYELGRILNGILLSITASIVLVALVVLASFIMPLSVSIGSLILAIVGIFITTLWQIPLYFWISRKTNLYVSILTCFVGNFLGLLINDTLIGKTWPFSWSALFPVSLIKMNINGLLVKSSEVVSNNTWTILASIVLFIIFSYLDAFLFKKQVSR